jgi:uncharacterized protein Smg (DUF494 family)
MYRTISLLVFVGAATAGIIVDRMAVVVGKHVIKTSDIERDLRLTEFLNREQLKINSDEKHRSAERLIDQEMIRQELLNAGFRRPDDTSASDLEVQLRQERFQGSQQRLREALGRYGLTEEQLHDQLVWQLTVLSFIEQRFRATTLMTNEDLRSYYDQHLAELRRQYPQDSSFEALEPKIRASLEGDGPEGDTDGDDGVADDF